MKDIETKKMDLQFKIDGLDYKRSQLACDMAERIGIVGLFFIDELPLDDPRISNDKEKLLNLEGQIYEATWELDRLEYIDEPERHIARKKCFDFVNVLPIEETDKFLKGLGLTSTTDLIEELIKNPNFIEEAIG